MLSILGATGRTGGHLLAGALDGGHGVQALARRPSALAGRAHPRLEVIEGDACDAAAVARTIDGTEVVLFALGHTPTSSADVLATAAGHVVSAARAAGVRRIVALTTGGIFHPDDRPTIGHRMLVRIAWMCLRPRFEDARRQAQIIGESGLDHVLVRATSLKDAEATGRIKAGYLDSRVSATVPRADVAAFMLEQLVDDRFVGHMPFVSRG